MARLPSEADLGGLQSLNSGRAIATVNPAPLYEGQAAIGKAIQGVGDGLAAVARNLSRAEEKEKNAADALAESKAGAAYQIETAKLDQAATNINDPDELEKHKQNYAGAAARSADMIPDAKRREGFLTRTSVAVNRDQIAIDTKAKGLRDARELASADQDIYTLEQDALKETDENKRVEKITAAQERLQGLAAKGLISPTVAVTKARSFAARIAEGSLPEDPAERAGILNGPVDASDREKILDRIGGNESSNNDNSQSSRSTAGGRFGFIDDTWLKTLGKYRPDITGDRDQLLALKKDKTLSREMAGKLLDENRMRLEREKVPVTAGTLYLAHFLGVDKAVETLKAPPGTPVEQILSAKAIRSNPEVLGSGKTPAAPDNGAAVKEAQAAVRAAEEAVVKKQQAGQDSTAEVEAQAKARQALIAAKKATPAAAGAGAASDFQIPPRGSPNSRVVEDQGKATTRRLPIAENVRAWTERAAAAADVKVEVYSGGQVGEGEDGPRTGSTRHDHGGSGDMKLFREVDGKRVYLSMNNPADVPVMKAFVREAVAAGATGVGAAVDYMGPESIHIGGGKEAVWGKKGGGAPAPWIQEAFNEGRALRGGVSTPYDASVAQRVAGKTTDSVVAWANRKMGSDGRISPMTQFIPEERRRALLSQAQRDEVNLERANAADLRAEVATIKTLIKTDQDSILSTGKPVAELTPERVEKAFGPDARQEFERDRSIQREFHYETKDFSTVPMGDLQERIDSLKGNTEAYAGTAEYSSRKALTEKAVEMATAEYNRRMVDPAAAVMTLPQVAQAAKGYKPETPETFRPVVAARLEAQARLEIPEPMRRVVTDDEAKAYAATLRPLAPGQVAAMEEVQGEIINGLVENVAAKYGEENVQKVMSQVLLKVTMRRDASEALSEAIDRVRNTDMGPILTTENRKKIEAENQRLAIERATGQKRDAELYDRRDKLDEAWRQPTPEMRRAAAVASVGATEPPGAGLDARPRPGAPDTPATRDTAPGARATPPAGPMTSGPGQYAAPTVRAVQMVEKDPSLMGKFIETYGLENAKRKLGSRVESWQFEQAQRNSGE